MSIQAFIKKNASLILSGAGAAGVIMTAVMAANSALKVQSVLEEAKEEKGEELTKWEKVNLAGPIYIPTVIAGVASIACVFGLNILNKRRQANLISAYALLDNSYREYKKKTEELYGVEAGKHVREGIAKDKYTKNIEKIDDDEELFYDFYSGRYFESTKEAVLSAEYKTNRAMAVDHSVGLNEFYKFLGLEELPEYESLGWSCSHIEKMYNHPWIEFEHETTAIDNDTDFNEGMKCTIINLPFDPFIDYLEQ